MFPAASSTRAPAAADLARSGGAERGAAERSRRGRAGRAQPRRGADEQAGAALEARRDSAGSRGKRGVEACINQSTTRMTTRGTKMRRTRTRSRTQTTTAIVALEKDEVLAFVDAKGLARLAATCRALCKVVDAAVTRRLASGKLQSRPRKGSRASTRLLAQREAIEESRRPAGTRNLAAGVHHAVFVSQNPAPNTPDYLRGMGDGICGRLGEDNAEDNSWVPLWHPTPILPSIRPSHVRQISCGAYHTAILEWDGSIHIFGVIGAEALAAQRASVLISSSIWGTPSRPRVEYIPTHLGHEPVQISSGTNTLAWTDVRGRVFVQDSRGLFRVNGFGEDADLGHAIQVSCGDCHFAVVTASGQLYTWGGGGHGRLGHGDTQDRHVPTQVRVPDSLETKNERVRVVACEASYRHTVVVTSDGDLLLFGEGSHGQLGQTTLSEHLRPVRCTVGVLASTRVVQVACGETFTAALTEIGQVIVLGSLATQNAVARAQHTAYRLTAGPCDCAAVQIAAGKTSLLMRLDNGVVETCGRGRCGQLGQGASVTLALHAGAPHLRPFSSFWYQLATGKEFRFAADLGHAFARGIILVLNALGGHTLAAVFSTAVKVNKFSSGVHGPHHVPKGENQPSIVPARFISATWLVALFVLRVVKVVFAQLAPKFELTRLASQSALFLNKLLSPALWQS